MTPRPGRTRPCGRQEARSRVEQARRYLRVAGAEAETDDPEASTNVAVGNAVLAGIAAADAISCILTGRRSAAPDHGSAAAFLRQALDDDHRAVATAFGRLIDLKTDAHYGAVTLAATKVEAALRQARTLVEHAERLIR